MERRSRARAQGRALLDGMDRAWFSAKYRTGLVGPLEIQAYRGYGTAGSLFLRGRVLELVGIKPPGEKASRLRNLGNMTRRFLSSEVPRARVRVAAIGQTTEVRADGEGYFEARLPFGGDPSGGTAWRSVELDLLWPPPRATISGGEVHAQGEVIVPLGASYGVISDLDDTVIQTGVTSLPTMVRTVLLNDASTRLPLDGVDALYDAFSQGPQGGEAPRNPIFYVSNGPWNLYDLLEEFLELNGLPAGPLFLRDWGPPYPQGPPQPAQARHDTNPFRHLPRTAVRPRRRLRGGGPGGLRARGPRTSGAGPRHLHPRRQPRRQTRRRGARHLPQAPERDRRRDGPHPRLRLRRRTRRRPRPRRPRGPPPSPRCPAPTLEPSTRTNRYTALRGVTSAGSCKTLRVVVPSCT